MYESYADPGPIQGHVVVKVIEPNFVEKQIVVCTSEDVDIGVWHSHQKQYTTHYETVTERSGYVKYWQVYTEKEYERFASSFEKDSE